MAKVRQRPSRGVLPPAAARTRTPRRDAEREERIQNEIMVDAYGEEERIGAWQCYMEDHLHFPFDARCIAVRAVSPLEVGDAVEVVEMAPDKECGSEIFVMIRHGRRNLAVPLIQLKVSGSDADEETRTAVEDWHYWVKMGYQF